MNTLRINRSLDTDVDPKQALRAHVDQLPIAQQREFVAGAAQCRHEVRSDEAGAAEDQYVERFALRPSVAAHQERGGCGGS